VTVWFGRDPFVGKLSSLPLVRPGITRRLSPQTKTLVCIPRARAWGAWGYEYAH
jgi:hypothetical protein